MCDRFDGEHLAARGRLWASVVVLHGYGASGAVHRAEASAFAEDGVEVLLPDAPGHGARADGRIERIAQLPDGERRAAIVAIAREWHGELAGIANGCRRRGSAAVGLVGISLGGFAALAALAQPCAFDAVAALLAEPELVDRARITKGNPPLLLGLAGRDEAVRAGVGRAFAGDYGAELCEYPESGHLMRAPDWADLWSRTAGFVQRHLATAARG